MHPSVSAQANIVRKMIEEESEKASLLPWLIAGTAIGIIANVALLAGAVWLVVTILRSMGVL